MNTFDLIIAIPLLWGAIMGFRKGLILELASLAGLFLGIWGAMHFSDFTATYLSDWLEVSPSLISLSAFLLTFLIIVIAIYLLAKMIDKTLKLAALGPLIRITGAIFGLIKYALVITVLLYAFEAINSRWEFMAKESYQNAYGYKWLRAVNQPIHDWLDQLDWKLELTEADIST